MMQMEADLENFAKHRNVYHDLESFVTSYSLMEKDFKIFVYPDGDPRFVNVHRFRDGKFSIESRFLSALMESPFVTEDADEAHAFFLPVHADAVVKQYPPSLKARNRDWSDAANFFSSYVDSLAQKYPFWNRSLGADHFFIACRDVGAALAAGPNRYLRQNTIRLVCNASYSLHSYAAHRDAALPQLHFPLAIPVSPIKGPKDRTILAFLSGQIIQSPLPGSGHVRGDLIRVWGNDTEMHISEYLPRPSANYPTSAYEDFMMSSKFCIAAAGGHVMSSRLMHTIYYGCIPVIIADYADLPFQDVLDWTTFSVFLMERDITMLKAVLKSITPEAYAAMRAALSAVQRHFSWNSPPDRYGAFHMILHEVWLRRHTLRYSAHMKLQT